MWAFHFVCVVSLGAELSCNNTIERGCLIIYVVVAQLSSLASLLIPTSHDSITQDLTPMPKPSGGARGSLWYQIIDIVFVSGFHCK